MSFDTIGNPNLEVLVNDDSIKLYNPRNCSFFDCKQGRTAANNLYTNPWRALNGQSPQYDNPTIKIISFKDNYNNKLYSFSISFGSRLVEEHYEMKDGWGWYEKRWGLAMFSSASIGCVTPNCTKNGNTIQFSDDRQIQLKNAGGSPSKDDGVLLVY